jgi:hypothetical protein
MSHRHFHVSEELVQRLVAAKCPLGAGPDLEREAAAIDHQLMILQDGTFLGSRVVELPYGGMAATIGVHVGCDVSRITIYGWELELPWDCKFHWLNDPGESKFGPSLYTLPGTSETFPRADVLNHQTVLTRGRALCGSLLGFGFENIPDHYRHGSSIEARLSLIDHVGRWFPASFSLWIDRSVRSHPKRVTKRRCLIGEPDLPEPQRTEGDPAPCATGSVSK